VFFFSSNNLFLVIYFNDFLKRDLQGNKLVSIKNDDLAYLKNLKVL
jgi:hypothetical protein